MLSETDLPASLSEIWFKGTITFWHVEVELKKSFTRNNQVWTQFKFDAVIIDGYLNPNTPDDKPLPARFMKEVEGAWNQWRCWVEVDPIPIEK